MRISWAAALAAFLLVLGVICAVIGYRHDDGHAIALGQVVTLAGVGWAFLALRDR